MNFSLKIQDQNMQVLSAREHPPQLNIVYLGPVKAVELLLLAISLFAIGIGSNTAYYYP